VVEFTLVLILLVTLFVALLQLGLTLYVRNTLVAAAAEGARYAANADRTPAEGAALSRRLIRASLADRYAEDVTAGYEDVAGVQTVFVQVQTSAPVIGLLGPSRSLTVRGHAMEEAW
jgi:Flp pilus assembly protein TadG